MNVMATKVPWWKQQKGGKSVGDDCWRRRRRRRRGGGGGGELRAEGERMGDWCVAVRIGPITNQITLDKYGSWEIKVTIPDPAENRD